MNKTITLAHGNGGAENNELISKVFYKAFKKPAHAISTFDFTNFDYYHHVDDEADKMDFKHMTNFINVMIPALEGMINAPTQDIKMNDE